MTTPIPYRVVMADLLAIWDARQRDGGTTLRGDLSHAKTPIIIRGIVAHAIASARGVLTLYEQKQQMAALPLVRAVHEDAITATWLLVDDDAWKMFLARGEQQRAVVLRQMLDQGIGDEETTQALHEAQAIVERVERITHVNIENRYRVVDPSGTEYLHYRIMSSLIHAGPAIVDRYTEPAPDTPAGMVYKIHPSHATGNAWMAIAVHHLAQALQVWDLCQDKRPDSAALSAVADRLGIDLPSETDDES